VKRARFGLGAGLLLAFALGGCGSGGVPDNVPRVQTGGTRVISKNTAEPITSGERLGNTLQPAVSQSGTMPTAGIGNDLTGAAGFEAVSDSDFIGVDEIDDFENPQAVANFGSNLQQFGAGFAVPGAGAATSAGAVATSTTTTTTRSTTNSAGAGGAGAGGTGAAGTGTATTTTTTTRSTTNAQ
jgi:hypothetical protein